MNTLVNVIKYGSRTIHSKVRNGTRKYVPKDLDGCVLYLPMDEKTVNLSLDMSGQNNHGTVYGAIETDGKINKGLYFDSIDDYVDCGNNNIFDMGNGDFSIVLWFISNSSGHEDLFMKGGYSPGGKSYTIINFNGSLGVIIDDDTTYKSVISSINYMDDNWHLAVGVRNGNNLRLYVDGNEDANSPTDITGYGSLDSIRPLRIGCGSDEATGGNPGNLFNGKVDEIRIYRRALSPDEIRIIYEQEN